MILKPTKNLSKYSMKVCFALLNSEYEDDLLANLKSSPQGQDLCTFGQWAEDEVSALFFNSDSGAAHYLYLL